MTTEEWMYKDSLMNCENIKQTCEMLFDDYNDLCEYVNGCKNYRAVHILRFVSFRMPRLRKFYKSISKFIVDKDDYSVAEFIDKSLYYATTYKEEYYKVIDAIMIFNNIRYNDNEMKRIAFLHENPLALFMSKSYIKEMINYYG